jgi:hypothetical protein
MRRKIKNKNNYYPYIIITKEMSVIVKKQICYTFSSNTATGAQNIQNNGASFSVALNSPIYVPNGTVDCTVEVLQAAVWNTSPNIAADFGNNKLTFSYAESVYNFTIPDGLYGVKDLNTNISRLLANAGLPSNLFLLSGDDSTQKTIITYTVSGVIIDFNVANSIRTVLGFNARLSPGENSSTAGQNDTSDNTAVFNRINSFFIRSSMVNNGLPLNNVGSGIIAAIPITAKPGSQINYAPTIPIPVDASNLIGTTLQFISFDLLDQDLRFVNTVGEYYSVTLAIRYKLLLTTESLPMVPN